MNNFSTLIDYHNSPEQTQHFVLIQHFESQFFDKACDWIEPIQKSALYGWAICRISASLAKVAEVP